jgi:FKBP-type peptidyl-prolyl cis-trans isomerase FkpA
VFAIEIETMKKLLLCVLTVWCVSAGCIKKENGCPPQKDIVAPATEQQVIADYLSANNISATKHVSGLYYQVGQAGTGGSPNNCSAILISYTGKLANGSVFDTNKNAAFTLGGLIEGWKIGLPLIQKGGSIKLYIPPSLGYGASDIKDNNGVVVIPANSMLIFDVSLVDFQ